MKHFIFSVLAVVLLSVSGCRWDDPAIQEIDVTAENSETAAPAEEPAAKESKEDEVIVPADSGAPAAPSPSDPEGSTPSPTPSLPPSLSIDAQKEFDARLGLVRLTWNVTGSVDEIYLWSNGFNRQAGDSSQDDPCGPIEQSGTTRYLLVNSIDSPNLGFELNEASPAYDALAPYLESAQSCGEAGCEGFAEDTAAPTCRIDLNTALPAASFYTRTLVKDAVYHLCAKTADGTTCVASSPVEVPNVSIDTTTVDAAPGGKIRFAFSYLHALREMAPPFGCVQDAAASDFSDREGGHGRLVAICPIERSGSRAMPSALRKLSYSSIPADTESSSYSLRKVADHRIAPDADLSFTAFGIGNGNADSAYFNIDLSEPVVTLKSGGAVHCDVSSLTEEHCAGRLDLLAKAVRDFDVFETNGSSEEKVLHGTTSAGAPIGLSSNQGPASAVSVEPESETEMRFNGVPRTHTHYKWQASVTVNGKTYESAWWTEPKFPSDFKLLDASQTLHPASWDTCEYEDTDDGESDCGVCVETNGFYQATVNWEGRHLKQIGVYCNSSMQGVVSVTNPVAIPNTYQQQGSLLGGPALAIQVPVNQSQGWSDQLVCVFTAESYDGVKTVQMQTWTPNCGYTQAVHGGDFDPDLQDAYIENGTGWANAADLWTLVSSQWDGE